jgi:ABC-type multidrug transport system fused ATPase/permease subunit
VPLSKLREKITVIPQDPTMFSGTLRFNIDPTGNISETVIIDLLKEAGLENLLERHASQDKSKTGLDLEITENGSNLSSGEKQLVCICRAILRRNKVIVLDEATANIDIITEQKIQRLIKKEFNECTVITIAHRLQTIIDSDNVLVLGDGRVVEYDTP